MPIRADREYRKAETFSAEDEGYIVSGYASTFDPYVLFEEQDGTQYIEVIDRKAFDSADMSDVIMQYDHEGRVFARQSNGSLEVTTDDHGLKIRADLSRSSGAKELYEEIKAELTTQMSFAFRVDEDEYVYDDKKKTVTRYIGRIKKVYDVSAVSIPANPTTEIGVDARAAFDGAIEEWQREALKRASAIKKLKLMTEV